jgi:hypothetical protein
MIKQPITRLSTKQYWICLIALLSVSLSLNTKGYSEPLPGNTPDAPEAVNSTFKIDTATEKVPVGTVLKIAFNNHMDSRVTQGGEPFTAVLLEDFTSIIKSGAGKSGVGQCNQTVSAQSNVESHKRIIIPAGTFIRGRVSEVKRPGLFSRGGAIGLNFDHIVLSTGDLLPLDLNLSTQNTLVNRKGELYSDPGVGKKVSRGVQDGLGTFNKFKDAGLQAGKNTAGGLGSIVTVPVAVTSGAVAGTAITSGKAVWALVGRGESIVINPGDSVVIDFGGSFNLPSEP